MTDAEQGEDEPGAGCEIPQEPPPEEKLRYRVIPSIDVEANEHFEHFVAYTPEPIETEKTESPSLPKAALIGIGVAILLVGLIGIAIWKVMSPQSPPINNLGTSYVSDAGLEGLLVLQWAGKTEYQLSVTPLNPQQLDGFAAVALNPPRPLFLDIRLLDSSSIVFCRKQILLPILPPPAEGQDPRQALLPQRTNGGDTVQNIAGVGGKINAIDLQGDLSCPEKSYKRIVAWQLLSNFPTLSEQADWLKRPPDQPANAKTLPTRSRPHARLSAGLPPMVEGDDRITADNSSHSIIETSGGRTFTIDNKRSLASVFGWTVLPMAIHFRCDKSAACVITRAGSSNVVHARLKMQHQ